MAGAGLQIHLEMVQVTEARAAAGMAEITLARRRRTGRQTQAPVVVAVRDPQGLTLAGQA